MKHLELVTFRIGMSKREKKILLLMHVMALLAIVLSAIELYVQWLLIAVVIFSGIVYRRRYFIGDTERLLRYSGDYGWQLFTGGSFAQIRILGSTVLMPLAIFFHCELQGKNHYQVIFNDAMNEIDFRRLTVYLKITVSTEE
ncbi:protein YgfX [Methylotuvimicrobium sp. KM2]|uniref:protein YgfX n=1 Tax=Methylotuvimicrobium sp. KM2 TaxID=3133976 RepID=UPI0031013734